VEYTDVPFDASAHRMLTVDEARARLAATEPLQFFTFVTGPDEDSGEVRDIAVEYGDEWPLAGLTQAAPVWLSLPDTGIVQLTRQAALQVGSTCRVNQRFQEFIPAGILSEIVLWALQSGLGTRELKMLTAGTGEHEGDEVPLVVAQTRATVEPFSNVKLLDTIVAVVRRVCGDAVADGAWIDYKMFHDLEHTSFRVVLPLLQAVIGDEQASNAWCYGIEISNSLIGLKQTIISGYLFCLDSTGGITDFEHGAGGFKRRGSTPEQAYAWTAEAVEEILGGIEVAFKGLAALTEHSVDTDYRNVMAQLFREAPVAKELQLRIIADLEETPGTLTMYDLACASSEAANLDGSTWRDVRTLHDLAGTIVHQGGGMCDGTLPRGCRRLLPEDWEADVSS